MTCWRQTVKIQANIIQNELLDSHIKKRNLHHSARDLGAVNMKPGWRKQVEITIYYWDKVTANSKGMLFLTSWCVLRWLFVINISVAEFVMLRIKKIWFTTWIDMSDIRQGDVKLESKMSMKSSMIFGV